MLRWLLFALLFAGSLGAAGWLGYVTQIFEPWLAVWAISWLVVVRTKPRNRHLHVVLLLAALATMIGAALLIGWLDARYAGFVVWVTRHIGPVLATVGFALPSTIVGAITLLNALALVAWLGIKMVQRPLIERAGLSGWEALLGMAYRRRETVWRLKPWWLWCRAIALGTTAVGVGLIAWQWWQLDEPSFAGWVRLLPAGLIAVGIEWWLWLSGEVDDEVEAEFAGGDLGPVKPAAMFEELWVRYRRVWPQHWRAAGNRAPEMPDG